MTENELITKQQLEIEMLRKKIAIADDCRRDLYKVLFNIGAPLNDNKLLYSKEQLKPFFKIVDIFDL